jgi:pyruvate kinase
MRRAKIVATLGPSSSKVDQIAGLIRSGMNVARVNMSHGTHEEHAKLIHNIRLASQQAGQEVAVLMDLQGPKIRVDKLQAPLLLKKGETWFIGPTRLKDQYKDKSKMYIPTTYEQLAQDCLSGTRILFDDGLIQAKSVSSDGELCEIKITVGGELKSNKGINLPDCEVSAPSFTQKDRKDLMFGLKHEIDAFALSFVRKKEDVEEVKFLLHRLKFDIPIISKIEKPQAIDNLNGILEVTDLIMVARGDMGVEVGNHLVPSIQKKIIERCNQRNIPVITATQMLETMTHNPEPTRAEASDVANAIWDGTDAVMLSGETATGAHPELVVKMMGKIIKEAEKTPKERPYLRYMDLSNVNASVMVAASMIAEKVKAKRILSVTESGNSCRKISMFRPQTSVLGVTNSLKTARRLCLYWGVNPYLIHNTNRDDFNFQEHVIHKVKEDKKLVNGDRLVITRGDGRFFARGSSNSVKVEIIKDRPKVLGSSDAIHEESDKDKRIMLDTSVCASCQSCISICPHDIWTVNKKEQRTIINSNKIGACTLDMQCVNACPTGAIEIIPLGEYET